MKAKDIGYISLTTALLAASAWIAIPIGSVPITLQTATLFLSAALLGKKRIALACLAYILLGSIGAPVFAGFTGGAAKLLSPTGGYILGFLPAGVVVGAFSEVKMPKGDWKAFAFWTTRMFLGAVVCYTIGTLWFMSVVGEDSGFWTVLLLCVLPYFPFEIVKICVAAFLSIKLKKIIQLS